uniref:non-specific serine/threonine protein kinase n=1 Tax=Phallusia mammillata TaxID=59560 RepID=A0A6F9DIU8_9ASCI|nr:uncharacterized protein LOC100184595 [Phallusia mammillata]
MRKVKTKQKVGVNLKSSGALNRSVSTYGKNTLRLLEVNKNWLEIQDEPQHKKGIFSDSDDSFVAPPVPTKQSPKRKPRLKERKKQEWSNKENTTSDSILSGDNTKLIKNIEDMDYSSVSEKPQKADIPDVINSSIAIIALNSSKAKFITNNRRRKHLKSEYKATDGWLTVSFSEPLHESELTLPFQTSVVHGFDDSTCELFAAPAIFKSIKPAQSTPLRNFTGQIPMSIARTKLDSKMFLENFGTPMSAVRTCQQSRIFRTKNLDKSDEDIFQLSFQEALSPKKQIPHRTLTALDKVLLECGQDKAKPFDNFLALMENGCRKIGEGVFAEVYHFQSLQGCDVALKVIPIEGTKILNGEKQKTFSEVLPEIVNSVELFNLKTSEESKTDSFISLYRVHLTYGPYPAVLLDAWDIHNSTKTSENDRPFLPDPNQHYVLFEFADGGIDIEHFKFNNASQSLAALKQTISGLAVAENTLMFEHRDLHWGNILVQKIETKLFSFTLNGINYSSETSGISIRIIDFTLSRMTKGGISLYQDLSNDEELFNADSSVDYQFEIYRMMRDELGNDWSLFRPRTNVLWIHYLIDKLINQVHYKSKRSKIHRQSIQTMRQLSKTILTFASCQEIVEKSSLFNR